MKNSILANINKGGVILLLAACSQTFDPTADELTQASAPGTSHAETTQQQDSSAASSTNNDLVAQLHGTWHVAHYYTTTAPSYLYTPDDGTQLLVTADSIHILAEVTLIEGFTSTPRDTTLQTAAYAYTPLTPRTLLVGTDTLRLTPTDQGLRIEGSHQGALLNQLTVEPQNR